SPDTTRSHSLAQLAWESGAPGNRQVSDGFLNRALSQTAASEDGLLPAVAIAAERPRIFYGSQAVVAVPSLDGLLLQAPAPLDEQQLQAELLELYQQHGNENLRSAGLNTLELSQILAQARGASRNSQAANYPDSPFARDLGEIAALIKAGVGLQIAFADCRTTADGQGTWDSHSNQAALDGPFRSAE